MRMNATATIISLLLALVCVLGGLKLVPIIMGSNETPYPEAGILIGWLIYRYGFYWWKTHRGQGNSTGEQS